MVQELLSDWWQEVTKRKYFNSIVASLLALLIVVGGWKGREWYVAQREAKAQLIFADALDEYQLALYHSLVKPGEKGKIEDHIQDTMIALNTIIEKYGSATLSAYAKVLKADTHLLQNETVEAIALMQEAVNQMGSSSPFYYLLKTKIALMMIDANQSDKGIFLLQELLNDKNNNQSDDTAYFLGSYYWSQGEYKDAARVWWRFAKGNQLKNGQKPSPWAPLVQEKLAQMSEIPQ